MILWINGAFGAGKTTVAELTAKKIEGSYIYDPETAGFFLWEALPEEIRMPENFQHLPLWREMNYRILKYMDTHYRGTIIVPMTIYNRVYYNEIIGRLREDGADVRHFILTAGKETLLKRLVLRGDSENGWAARHIDACLSAFASEITEVKIDTEEKTPEEIVSEIICRCEINDSQL